MKKLFHRFMYFVELWGTPDPWMDGAIISAAFAWELAGPLAEFHESDEWEELPMRTA